MFTYGGIDVVRGNGQKIFSHSVHESAFGLSDIFVASFTGDTVYQIVAFAVNLGPGLVRPSIEFFFHLPQV